MIKRFFIFTIIALPFFGITQDNKDFGIQFTGFVKTDILWDSRQTVDARDGHFLLYPKKENLDTQGNDINARSKFNIMSIQTRLKGNISGPDAFGAKTSAVIEGAFFGNIGSDINGFRLRHAFAKLRWENSELLVGQYWHPMFVTANFPGTISFNTGVPFQPFSRNPQIRYTQYFGNFKAIATAISQIDFKDSGPNGASTEYLRNSSIPEMNLGIEYNFKRLEKEFLIGVSGNFKRLLPINQATYTKDTINIIAKIDNVIDGYSVMAYVKYKTSDITLKLEAVKGQLMQSMIMLGGYAVNDLGGYEKPGIEYTAVNTTSFWTDIHTNGKKLQGGLFAGYTKNDGTNIKNNVEYFSRGADIDYVYRIAPRIIMNSGKMRVAGEVEYTVAAYGTTDIDGKVKDSKEIGNTRFLLALYYFF